MATIHVPQIPSHALDAALDGFEKIVGSDSVVTAAEDLREFRDPFQPPTWDEYTASAVVMPTTVEELQAIVRVANQRKRAVVGARARAQQRLRRRRAEDEGLGDREPAEDEPRARDRRGARVRGRRARRALVRPLRGIARGRAQALALDARTSAGGASSETRWTTASPTSRTAATSRPRADWRSSSPAGNCCAPAWGRCPATSRGTCTSAGWARRSIRCSCSRTSGSSRRWGVWLMPQPEVYMPLWMQGRGATTTSGRSSTRSAS